MQRARRPLVLVGQAGSKRIQHFEEALRLSGRSASFISWLELAQDPSRLAAECPRDALVRLDAAGADHETSMRFLERAGGMAVPSLGRGQLVQPRLVHEGFLSTLRAMEASLAARPDVSLTTPVSSLEALFDKRVTSRAWESMSLPVPRAIRTPLHTLADLVEAMRDAQMKQAYVKVSSGSSAALLALVSAGRLLAGSPGGESPHAMTTMEEHAGAYFSSRKVRRVEGAALEKVIAFLLAEGAQVEESLPKARLQNRNFDVRIVVVDGHAKSVVVRASTIPITNLHLGGSRGDVDALRALCPREAWASAMHDAERAARAFPSLVVGIDLLFLPRFQGHALLEGNAFGDFFPGYLMNGRTVHKHVIDALELRGA